MNSPCAILCRLWRLRMYGARAPPRPAGPQPPPASFFSTHGSSSQAIYRLRRAFSFHCKTHRTLIEAAPRFQTGPAALGPQWAGRPAGGLLHCGDGPDHGFLPASELRPAGGISPPGRGNRDARRLGDYGAMVGDIPRYHSSRAHLYAPSHPDTAHQDGTSADTAVRADIRRSPGHLADGDILIDPAVFSDLSILRNKHAVQTMGECRTAVDDRTGPDVSAMAAGAPQKQEAENSAPYPRVSSLPEAIKHPKEGQMISFGCIDQSISQLHILTLRSFACFWLRSRDSHADRLARSP